MKNTLKALTGSVVAIAVAFFVVSVVAQEHPQEHPKEHEQEHPEQEKEEAKNMKKGFLQSLETFIDFKLNKSESLPVQGIFPVQTLEGDPVKFDGDLSLKKIHKDKVIEYGKNTYFVCADFEEKTDRGTTAYDFDFFMVKSGDSWQMGCILLHKVNGKKKITYRDNKPVPAGAEKEEGGDEEHPDSEHQK